MVKKKSLPVPGQVITTLSISSGSQSFVELTADVMKNVQLRLK